ncbi:hypothetical protein GR268_37650 [Rhizobium leguminosarum]|uniref:hypothetical protein n=1 Tax=Rhizobium leguminosarum TaxID=384 RepID=UPI0013F790C6|nr:hypothetical protein [Rhizobium leguminosarum]NEJ82289.1 hypothetical protein [Rhizobium leguminosarum]NKK78030.1 hypothetical protein [Rhizobium leguminosarum bv. viciae]
MQPIVRKLERARADVAFLVRAFSSMRIEDEDDHTVFRLRDWPDEHMPDVVEFVDGNAWAHSQTGGANA